MSENLHIDIWSYYYQQCDDLIHLAEKNIRCNCKPNYMSVITKTIIVVNINVN